MERVGIVEERKIRYEWESEGKRGSDSSIHEILEPVSVISPEHVWAEINGFCRNGVVLEITVQNSFSRSFPSIFEENSLPSFRGITRNQASIECLTHDRPMMRANLEPNWSIWRLTLLTFENFIRFLFEKQSGSRTLAWKGILIVKLQPFDRINFQNFIARSHAIKDSSYRKNKQNRVEPFHFQNSTYLRKRIKKKNHKVDFFESELRSRSRNPPLSAPR